MSNARSRILKRAARGLAGVLLGAAAAAAVSPSFREFAGDGPLGVALAVSIPPAALALDKWWRSRK